MFRFRRLAAMVVVCCVCLFVLPVSAVEDAGLTVEPDVLEEEPVADEGPGELVGVELLSLSPITPSDANGLTAIMLQLLGDYDPVVVEYRYQQSGSTYYNYLREVQPDYPWLVSAGIFALVLFTILRGWGAWLCRK